MARITLSRHKKSPAVISLQGSYNRIVYLSARIYSKITMIHMTNYPDNNQSEQKYVNNDDLADKIGRHGH